MSSTSATDQEAIIRPRIAVNPEQVAPNLEPKTTKSSGKSSHSKSRSRSKTTTDGSKTTKTTSTTSSGFAALAFENGNLDDSRARINRSRRTTSPPENAYRAYVHAVQTAPNEDSMIHISTKLLKDFDDNLQYTKVYNQGFNSFPADVGFNNGLSVPKPDLVEALQHPAFRPFPIKAELGGAAVLIDDPDSMTLPHLAGEWKGRGKDMEEARTQSAYSGAALMYGRNEALAYLDTPDPPGYAAVSTFTIDGTNINFFSHYAAPSGVEDEKLDYHQYPITFTNLVNSFEEFKRGRKQLRNLQETPGTSRTLCEIG
ncbi:hypothetical protein C8A03DRAFT_41478 [Achaetomium macrosporum]|uniref:Uncharacterized protein n=1 Tax=Achaetomium macrosporum TaxID=79813 RepID=A0AAN7CFG7_9PEZI|nr:hypothetical protein C8A03DRAFT_41478 [Achaetomium macrosporum]